MRNIADILQKWKDIRNADIMPNRSDICSTADIPTLYAIGRDKFTFLKTNLKYIN